MAKKVPEEVQILLNTLVAHCDQEDRSIRERQLRTWRRLKLFWEGFTQVWWSETAHDWRIYDETQYQNNDQSYYDKQINVFRAYLESIIAALSVTVPPVKCYPDDADDSLDLATAKAGDKIAELLYRHNDIPLLWLHGLFVYCTEGMVGCWTTPKKDKSYGTYKVDDLEDQVENHEFTVCPLCGETLEDNIVDEFTKQEKNEFQPGDDDVEIQAALNKGLDMCPSCGQMMDPELRQESFVVTKIVGTTEEAKSRVCMKAFGGLNIKVPNYARSQEECPYLQYSYERHYAMAYEEFDVLIKDKERLNRLTAQNSPGSYDAYEQWARLSPQYQGEYPLNVVTEKHSWIRPALYNILSEPKDVAALKKRYPNGVHITHINSMFADACNASLDDEWTLTYNPLANFIHYDPIGLLLTSIQDITNDLTSFILQTIEHGVSLTFADQSVVNFKGLAQMEVAPGAMIPVTSKGGKPLSDNFHELRTASLSGEVMPFATNIQSMGQLVSGALPSLFGGQLEGAGGDTASGYSMSRSQALQRLQNTWKMFTSWWKQINGKAIPMMIKEIKEDEKDVQKDNRGNFINVFIRKAELEGRIGKVELEANENLPMTWAQRKDVVLKMLEATNPQIMAWFAAPENIPIMREAMGLDDLFIPGDDDRIKQYDEIKILLDTKPQEVPPSEEMIVQAEQAGVPPPEPQETSSVDVDPDYDNHAVEFEICRKWIISEAGRLAKTDNPEGYKNVLLHGKMHLEYMQQQQMAQMQQQQQDNTPEKKPNKSSKIEGDGDVQAAQ